MEKETFLDRLIKEFDELKDKREKLQSFVNSEKINNVNEVQKPLLIVQLSIMKSYENVLGGRIENLSKPVD